MELLWIFLLIANVFVANADKSNVCRECVIFNVPHILCAPDVSEVYLTPYCEYVNQPQYKNLLSPDCIVPLDCARPDWCTPLCSKPLDYGYLTNPDNKDAPIEYQETDSKGAPIDVRYGYSYSPDRVETAKIVNDSGQLKKEDAKEEDLESENPLLVDYLNGAPPKKPPTQSKPPKWTPEPLKWPPTYCEPPKWPPPCPEPPTWPPPGIDPPIWSPSCTEPPKYCEPPKWLPPYVDDPSKSPPECIKPPKPYCPLKECVTPFLQNAPTSSVAFGCYPPFCVNPKYYSELSKLYKKYDDEPDVFEPFDAGYKTGGTTRQGTIPAGKTQIFYNDNPRDKVWSTVGLRDGKDVPQICFDRDYIEKCCRACSLLPNPEHGPKFNPDPYSPRALEQDPGQPLQQPPPPYSTADILSHNPDVDSRRIEPEPSASNTPSDINEYNVDPRGFDIDFTTMGRPGAEHPDGVPVDANAESGLVKIGQTAT